MTVARSLNRTTGPASEPVTTAEAKKHLELLSTDSTHDSAIDDFIAAGREQVEHDTGYALITQNHTLSFAEFPSQRWACPSYPRLDTTVIPLEIRPIQTIDSITYYDSNNSQQTLATSVYGLNTAQRLCYLKYNQSWPSVTPQYGGIVISMTTGYGSAANVPNLFKQMILMQVQAWFDPYQRPQSMDAYERLQSRVATPHYAGNPV